MVFFLLKLAVTIFNTFYCTITLAPNGINDSLAILKNCLPKGIPTIVIHHRHPRIRFPRAISHPKKSIHIRLTRNENTPLPYMTSLPNGQKASDANLKHCMPTGIPMIVTHHKHPAMIQDRPPRIPPNMNQRIFPNVFMIFS